MPSGQFKKREPIENRIENPNKRTKVLYLRGGSDWLSRPTENATIPDRAYDMHTYEGKKKGRGLEHFFNEAATVKNERFPNDWEEAGKKAHFQAQKEEVSEAHVIKAIKEKVKIAGKGKRPASEFVIDLFEG